jgi:hypothetical protein
MMNLSHIAQKSNLDLKKIRIILVLPTLFVSYSLAGIKENAGECGKIVDFYPVSTYILCLLV